jgi:leucyl-tRNA synthetase
VKRYNPKEIEPKWQQTWAENKTYEVSEDSTRSKRYVNAMFPYPSGAGLHVGHVRNYSITDAIARFQRQKGHNVLTAMGWDGFGLPAENYAIKTGVAPAISTAENIKNFKSQLERLGMSYDWSREVTTTDPEYYRWTQWLFIQLFNQGLAYQKQSLQWWCPHDKTVLANEQVEGGKCWRCGNEVIKKSMKQWFFKITDYADDLLEGIEDLDWPTKIKTMQRNWIGKSKGAEISFVIDGSTESIPVFTTRPDTLYGATFLVIAPEHPLVEQLATTDRKDGVLAYKTQAVKKSEIQRQENKEKTGEFTGSYAVNPINGEKLPVWVADYVLMGYGTGAIMAVPAHDERDQAFAEAFNLPIVEVVTEDVSQPTNGHGTEGVLKNSGEFTGMFTSDAREKMVIELEKKGVASEKTNYKMRDWLISRQRYWGAPIPIIHCPKDGAVAVPETQLPVVLPEVKNYEPDGSGKSVLAKEDAWLHVDCPKCGGPAERETDTMDGYVCSSWYLFRYADAQNTQAPWDPEKADYWAPLDFYCGGDHAVAHLLYVRFWTRVFNKMGLLNFVEPIKRLVYNGYIYASDGTKMSKSKGNVVDPLEVIDSGYGADALRTYELFCGPYEQDTAWDAGGVAGTFRFINRVWTLVQEFGEATTQIDAPENVAVYRAVHKAIKKVTRDLEVLSFNTAIAAQMELVNELYKQKEADKYASHDTWQFALTNLTQLMAPFAPHVAEELWVELGHEGSVHIGGWPAHDDAYLVEDTVTVAVQVNGKLRGTITAPTNSDQDTVVALAQAEEKIAANIADKQIVKTIYVANKLLNFVVR